VKCMFSNEGTSSEEHVLPQWMQKRFSLANQTYNLPNGSQIAYRNAKVPAAAAHNGKFGEIEDRLSRGVASLQDVYLWAFKVHIGLIYRSASLRIDIRSPTSPNFWNVEGFGQEIWLFQQLYSIWARGGTIEPDPFGSVFRMRALTAAPRFDFIHNIQSGTMFFQLGDDVIFVALYDQARALTSNMSAQLEWHRGYISTLPENQRDDAAFMAQRTWASESAYFLYRSRGGMSYFASEDSFSVIPPFSRPITRPSDQEEYRGFCRSFGLKLETFGGEAGHTYLPFSSEDVAELRSGQAPTV
jgi:hypothetical protein